MSQSSTHHMNSISLQCFVYCFILQYSNNTSPLSSAPQSPPTSPCDSLSSSNVTKPYNSSNDYHAHYQAQETLQQHFEQIRMVSY